MECEVVGRNPLIITLTSAITIHSHDVAPAAFSHCICIQAIIEQLEPLSDENAWTLDMFVDWYHKEVIPLIE